MEVKPLEEMTLAELKEKAKNLGVENLEAFNNKAALVSTIIALQKQTTIPIVKDDVKVDKEQWKSKYMRMRDQLAKQPKVRFFIPLEGKEKPGELERIPTDYPFIYGADQIKHISGAVKTAQLNGFKMVFPKGKMIEIPEQVADLFAESYQMLSEAEKEKSLDRSEDVRKALE